MYRKARKGLAFVLIVPVVTSVLVSIHRYLVWKGIQLMHNPQMVLENGTRVGVTSISVNASAVYIEAATIGPVEGGAGWIAILGGDDTVFTFVEGQEWPNVAPGCDFRYVMRLTVTPDPEEPRWAADGSLVGTPLMEVRLSQGVSYLPLMG